MKTCEKCKTVKSNESFSKDRNSEDGLQGWCIECRKAHYQLKKEEISEKGRAHRKENPEHYRKRRLRRYHLTIERYLEILASQNGVCAICGTDEPGGRQNYRSVFVWFIDHDHSCCDITAGSCGKCVRGLLCVACNQGLGSFKDSLARLDKAKSYLQAHSLKSMPAEFPC